MGGGNDLIQGACIQEEMRNKTELCERPTKHTDEEGQRDRTKTEAEVTQEEAMVLQKKDGQHFAV